jgi:hypothetical protein
VDERIVQPESRAEILNNRLLFSPPADEPHGREHFTLVWLLGAHLARGYLGAVDMLTRTSKRSDFAPDASIYPEERDPITGGRKLEEVAFEIVSEQSLDVASRKARELSRRGVRRLFCISLKQQQVLEWSAGARGWQALRSDEVIEDRCLVRPLPVRTLLDTAATDDAVARALLAKETPAITQALLESKLQGQREGRREGLVDGVRRTVITILAARGVQLDDTARARIMACDDLARLERWVARAAVATQLDEVIEDERAPSR